MTKIISIANHKGGVGKTTTAYNLAYELSVKGNKVLAIDCDMQGNMSEAFSVRKRNKMSLSKLLDFELENTKLLEEKELPNKNDFIQNIHGVDIIYSDMSLTSIDNKLKIEMGAELILKAFLDKIKDNYDYIILDLSPNLNSITINALATSDSVIIPMTLDKFSLLGFEGFLSSIISVKKRINRNLKIDGILLTIVDDRLNLSKEIRQELKNAVNNSIKIFETEIPKTTQVGKAITKTLPISIYSKKNKASRAYKQLATEVLNLERKE